MRALLSNRTYLHLFAAQIVALLGTGLATVALGLVAFELAGERAGLVLGTALTLKMVAYVGLSPFAGALAARIPRRRLLVSLDLMRAATALALPFVNEIWQIYLLIFLLQSGSALFTPSFQATLPDVLPREEDYTRALSLSRLAYDLESLLSPMLAAALLTVVSFNGLFFGTVLGFLASAALVLSVVLPSPATARRRSFVEDTTRGLKIYFRTPRLQGLLALNASAAAAVAMVFVNTVVLVRADLGRGEADLAVALAAFGGGSMVVALALPRLLDRLADRTVMLSGAILLVGTELMLAALVWAEALNWPRLLVGWAMLGAGYSMVMTPAGRLLRRSSHPEDRPAVFAAQFALSHFCWLVAYPLAGALQTLWGTLPTLLVLASLAFAAVLVARHLWPRNAPRALSHSHDDLPPDHPHLRGERTHSHTIVIDDFHHYWPDRV